MGIPHRDPHGGSPRGSPWGSTIMMGIELFVQNAIYSMCVEFAEFVPPDEAIDLLFLGLTKNDIFKFVEMLVMVIIALLVILLVVRPLISRAMDSIPSAQEKDEQLFHSYINYFIDALYQHIKHVLPTQYIVVFLCDKQAPAG